MKLCYRQIREDDAPFLFQVFSGPEYQLYFAENDTTEEGWRERIRLFEGGDSKIILDEKKPIGWMMYQVTGETLKLHLVVLLEQERHKGYGKAILNGLLELYPSVRKMKLDVQQRNTNARRFYQKFGFKIVSEERQPVGDGSEMYYNMEYTR